MISEPVLRSKTCRNFHKDCHCKYGDRCNFKHESNASRSSNIALTLREYPEIITMRTFRKKLLFSSQLFTSFSFWFYPTNKCCFNIPSILLTPTFQCTFFLVQNYYQKFKFAQFVWMSIFCLPIHLFAICLRILLAFTLFPYNLLIKHIFKLSLVCLPIFIFKKSISLKHFHEGPQDVILQLTFWYRFMKLSKKNDLIITAQRNRIKLVTIVSWMINLLVLVSSMARTCLITGNDLCIEVEP